MENKEEDHVQKLTTAEIKPRLFIPLLVLISGLVATFAASYFVYQHLQYQNNYRLGKELLEVDQSIRARMAAYLGVLRAGAGLFAANPFVTSEQFKAFLNRLDIPNEYPGAQGFGYSVRFGKDKMDGIAAMMRRQGMTNFQVWPPDERSEYHSILYLEPLDIRNQRAIGYDMFTDPVRRSAMERARDTGRPAATGKVTLVQEIVGAGPKQVGFLAYMPVYLGGAVPETTEQRRDLLQGFVYCPFRANDFIQVLLASTNNPHLVIELYDGPELRSDNLLFASAKASPEATTLRKTLHVVGRPWTIRVAAEPSFFENVENKFFFLLPLTGTLVSILLFYFTRAEAIARARTESTAVEFAMQREWLHVTLSSIGDAVITTDVNGRIQFMNSVAEKWTGWSWAEANTKYLPQVFRLKHEKTGEPLRNPAERALQEGKVVHIAEDSVLIQKNGDQLFVEDSAAPIRDHAGKTIGAVIVFREVSARRRAEQRIRAQLAVTSVLAEAPGLETAAEKLLRAICQELRFSYGIFWVFNHEEQYARVFKHWNVEDLRIEAFRRSKVNFQPKFGQGIPGLVWQTQAPQWISNVSLETNYPRHAAAGEAGLKAALAFPIKIAGDLHGAIELFSTEVLEPDNELLEVVSGLGGQIGQFIERKRAEQTLRESEELHRTVTETAADGIVTLDAGNRIVSVNSAMEKIFGYDQNELIGTEFTQLLPERMRTAHLRAMQTFIKSGQTQLSRSGIDLIGLRKDKKEIPLEVSFGMTIRDGHHLFTGMIRDVTARKESEEKLRQSEERFRLLVERAEDYAIIIMDKEGIITNWNPGAERIFGFSEQEIVGQGSEIIFTPEDRKKNIPLKEMETAFQHGQATDERWHIRKNGSQFWASGYLILLKEGPDETPGFAKILRDMTQRKQAEEAIRQLNQDLEERVQRRTAALQESKEQMEAFTYTVAHDLRAPLRAMQGFSHALLEDYGPSLSSEAQDFIARIRSSAARMDALIQDLLSYSQLSRTDLHFAVVNVSEVVSRAVETFQEEINRQGAIVTVEADQSNVLGHFATLQHVVENLIANALKFVEKGITPKVQITAVAMNDVVRLNIQDNGIGIALEHQERIFKVFERLHGQESYPGTGIGLAIVKKGVERMNGNVGLVSESGRGSLFWIELPKARPEEPA
ncbi:MAG: PAS domain S-box protein [Verrucomicrobiales bacterium]